MLIQTSTTISYKFLSTFCIYFIFFLLFGSLLLLTESTLSPHPPSPTDTVQQQPSLPSTDSFPIADFSSKPEQECDHCQRCLYMTFIWFQRAESKRMLKHKLKHICKRYFEYRRHCLTTLLPRLSIIAERMSAAYLDGHYKPIRTCILLKECTKNQASLDADEMRSLRSLAINETIDGNGQSFDAALTTISTTINETTT